MKKSIFISVMIVFILNTLFSSAIPQNRKIITLKNNNACYSKSAKLDRKNQEDNTNADTRPKIIASIPEEKIYLYALNEQDGWYKGIVLSINGVNKFFNWKAVTFPGWNTLHYLDLNNDNKKELVVMLTQNKGTGMFRNTVHIINPENFSEYKVKDALDIVYDNIDIRILSKKEMEIMINDTIYNAKILKSTRPSEIEKTFFHNFIEYYIEDNKLKAKVGIEVQFLSYIGNIIIDYEFKDDEFKIDKIAFEGNPKVTVTTLQVK